MDAHHARLGRAPYLLTIAVLVPPLLAGCSPGSEVTPGPQQSEVASAPEGVPLVKTGPLPPRPPTVVVAGQEVEPLVVQWIVEDDVLRVAPEAEAAIVLPTVAGAPELSFTVEHPTVPPTLYVEVFEELDERRHPTGEGSRFDCVVGGSDCAVEATPQALQLTVKMGSVRDCVVVLQAGYTVPPDLLEQVSDAPGIATASWGVDVS